MGGHHSSVVQGGQRAKSVSARGCEAHRHHQTAPLAYEEYVAHLEVAPLEVVTEISGDGDGSLLLHAVQYQHRASRWGGIKRLMLLQDKSTPR